MQAIPLQAVPAQVVRTVLGGQNVELSLYEKPQGLFVDVSADGVAVVLAVVARDAVPLICREYSGFRGNLLFVDNQGADDPTSTGLGSRFELVYLTAAEYAKL